jgi:thiopeptide-type bacteriocin biosynthesis protein
MDKLHLQFYSKFIFRTPINSFQSVVENDILIESLYLSSPTFYHEYEKYLSNPIVNYNEFNKMELSLYKYKTRASNRCTPFGLFAGLSIGEWKNKNEICFNSDLKKNLKRKTRLDMNVLCELASEITKKQFIKPYLNYHPNSSIYIFGNSYRYVEYYFKNNRRFHNIAKVDYTDYLKYILEECEKGLSRKQLRDLLISNKITEHEADLFIGELIDSQIILSQFEPTITGLDFFDVIINILTEIQKIDNNTELKQLTKILLDINEKLKKLDENILNPISSYRNVFNLLATCLPNLEETNLFQTDLYKNPISNTLDLKIQEQIEKALQFLNKISTKRENVNLENFKKRYFDRFEDDEVPLLVALDNESGLGYPEKDFHGINSLIEGININKKNTDSNLKWDNFQSILHRILINSINEKKKIVKINFDDFKDIDYSGDSLPTTFSVMFKVLDPHTNKIEITSIAGSSAANLLGRFAGGDNMLENILKDISHYEEQALPNKIIAEIVHLPESRTGNILARPLLRNFEIPYLAKSSTNKKFQIKMKDLYLKLLNNKIILFDKRLNKEIIPRLSNAHNYSYNSLPVYHFLCDLQTQYFPKSSLGFNWGVLSDQYTFLPRVEFEDTILHTAKWQIKKSDLNLLQNKSFTNQQKISAFYELKVKFDLPEKFLITNGDNELLIDCRSEMAINTFIDIAKNKYSLLINEYLFDNNSSCITDSENKNFTNEFIAVIFNENNLENNTQDFQIKKIPSTKKQFNLGSEWLFYKIYCGVKTADFILTSKIKSITEKLFSLGIIDKWFFIRYSDPESHIRIRFHITNLQRLGDILQLINNELNPLIDQNFIFKLTTDSYIRELDRYGDNSIELVEGLFSNDSIFVIDILSKLKGDNVDKIRWQIALISIDSFLNDFNLILDEKYNLIESLRNSFFKEHGGDKNLKISLDSKFRNLRVDVENALENAKWKEEKYSSIVCFIKKRSELNSPIVKEIIEIIKSDKLNIELNDLLSSIMHMNLDRLFVGRNRTNEFVVYDLLARHYKSKIVRKKTQY